MEQDRFDSLTKSVAKRTNRRRMVQSIFGLGIGAAAASAVLSPAEAARRGFAGPKFPCLHPDCADVGSGCGSSDECCSGCCVSAGGADPVCATSDVCEM